MAPPRLPIAVIRERMDWIDGLEPAERWLIHQYGLSAAIQALNATHNSKMSPVRFLAEAGRLPIAEDRPQTYETSRERQARRLAARLGMKACARG